MPFTLQELAEMAAADAEIEAEELTIEDYRETDARDRAVRMERKGPKGRKVAAQKKAYYEANREKVAAQQKAYREANREKVAKYQREYQKRKREEKKDAGKEMECCGNHHRPTGRTGGDGTAYAHHPRALQTGGL